MEREVAPLLASSSRQRLLTIIEEHPGISVSAAARLAGMYWASTAVHAERLCAQGLVRSERAGRRRVLFAASLARPDAAPGILGEPACLHVAEVIAAHPHRRIWELCELAGMSERAVYHHVKRLVDARLVLRGGAGYRGLRAAPALDAWLAARGGSA